MELEVFRHLLIAVADEMGIVLRKTAFSANIKERRDYSCALYDAGGATIAMGDHMPVHLGAMPLSVKHALEAHRFAPGDVVILNDPFCGGTHLPDITLVSAVFNQSGGRPDFYLASRAHHADVGGMSPGSMPLAREIYQEGIRIPPICLVRSGQMDEGLLRLILANVRTPEERRGDLHAQLMCMKRGEDRLLEIIATQGQKKVTKKLRQLQLYSERMMRNRIAALPDGDYSFSDCLDDDGVTAAPVHIRVSIRIRGDSAEVDFTASDPQSPGPVNANYAVVVSATMYVFRCLITEDVPFTAGLMRPISVIVRPGSVVSAVAPAAMAGGNVETSQRVTDVLLGALSAAVDGQIPAASSGTMTNLSFGGWDSKRGRSFAYYETTAGGMGGGPLHPGLSATHTHMTNSWNTPVEAFERAYPVRVRKYSVRKASGGSGVCSGGDGIERVLEFLEPAEVTLLSDRRHNPPYGLNGGMPGARGSAKITRKGKSSPVASKSKTEVAAGDILHIETPGGGGYGKSGLTAAKS